MINFQAKKQLVHTTPWDCFWVNDFPLFEPSEIDEDSDTISWQSTHHPFTAPFDKDLKILQDSQSELNVEKLKAMTAQV